VKLRGGTNLGGFSVGILVLDTRFPRIAGDIGNAATFDFPVLYHPVRGASSDRVVRRPDADLLRLFVEGARALERAGVRAITTSCGFLARFQAELAEAVAVPVFTSSLMLVPMVHRMLPRGRAVGIMTVDASSLGAPHLTGAGITPDMAVVVAGLETEKEFARVMLDDALEGVEYRESLKPLLEQLPSREKRILLLRFFGNMTQSQIATELGISQMHVSRLLARTLTQLREGLTTEE
jgi:RNA polymerase sigma factor (sigma-70 family)